MWQPIETAPKDKEVLLYCPWCGVVRGRWKGCEYQSNPRPYWTNDRERVYGVINTRNDQPTHWMPLPEAPGAKAQPASSLNLSDPAVQKRLAAQLGYVPAQPAPSVPEGWKLMPIEPTQEMLDAGEDTFSSTYTGTPTSTPIDVYNAMLAAAPEIKP